MNRWAAAFAALVLATSAAAADKWREYGYLENAFAIQFPAQPKITEGSYATALLTVSATIYALDRDDARYSVTVADFSKTQLSELTIMELAVENFKNRAEIVVDIPHRVNRHLGRQLSVAGHDGSRSSVALFYYQRRLYLVEGTMLPTSADPESSDGARFQQSLRFTNDARPQGEELNRLRFARPDIPFSALDH